MAQLALFLNFMYLYNMWNTYLVNKAREEDRLTQDQKEQIELWELNKNSTCACCAKVTDVLIYVLVFLVFG